VFPKPRPVYGASPWYAVFLAPPDELEDVLFDSRSCLHIASALFAEPTRLIFFEKKNLSVPLPYSLLFCGKEECCPFSAGLFPGLLGERVFEVPYPPHFSPRAVSFNDGKVYSSLQVFYSLLTHPYTQ